MPGPKTILTARGRPAIAFLADLTKHTLTGTLIQEPETDVREPSLVMEKLDELEKRYEDFLPHNEKTLAPRILRTNKGKAKLQFITSNHARFRAAAEILEGMSLTQQRIEFSRFSLGAPPWLIHSLGVNCSLETADRKLIWALRPTNTIEGGLLAPAMGEGSRPDDIIKGKWLPETTARRGFHEELGFSPDSASDELQITFYSAVTQFGNGGISISGHATTSLTLQQVLEQHQHALDADEHINGLYICDVNPEAFTAFLNAHPPEEWTSWGVGSIWDLATHRLHRKIDHVELQPMEPETVTS